MSRRNVYLSINDVAEREFEEYTGIQIELRDASNCGTVASTGQQMVQQKLKVFVSTVRAINRTAVQCAALRKDQADVDMYSIFGVILVNGTYACNDRVQTHYIFFAAKKFMWQNCDKNNRGTFQPMVIVDLDLHHI